MRNKSIRYYIILFCMVLFAAFSGCAKGDGASTASRADNTPVRIGSLKGPTTMGLVNLTDDVESGAADADYTFTMATQADELAAKLVSGDLDIALLPANAAAALYQKTDGGITVIDINTLGVLYLVTGREDISSIRDLAGQKVLTTGQGTTPEYVLRYLLEEYGVTDCRTEFKSEATELAAILSEDPQQIAILPQPFATSALMQNDALRSAFSLSQEWEKLENGSLMVTGVTVVRTQFLSEHPDAVKTFLQYHQESAQKALEDPEKTAQLIAAQGIIEKSAVAERALPCCGIACITGDEMKEALSGYLTVLYEQDPSSVGGALPEDSFYFIK